MPNKQAAIIIPTVLIGAAGSDEDGPLKLAIINRDLKTQYEVK